MIKVLLVALHLVVVSWTAAPQPKGFTVEGYYVYRSTNNAAYVKLGGTKDLTVSDSTVVAGNKYCYRLETVGVETLSGQPVSSPLVSKPTAAVCVEVGTE